jgi:LPXTG-motif cell wall-anchored protein
VLGNQQSLPVTGSGSRIAVVGALLIALGAVLVFLARVRHHAHTV